MQEHDIAGSSAGLSPCEVLRLFNEKAERALSTRFVQGLMEKKKLACTIRYDADKGLETEVDGPDQEEVEALVLTLRFFMQDRDGISVRSLERVYARAELRPDLEQQCRKARENLNRIWGERIPLRLNDQTITRWELLEVFVYGDLAHANPEKRRRLENWKAGLGPMFKMLEFEFRTTLVGFLDVVAGIRSLNEKALARLICA